MGIIEKFFHFIIFNKKRAVWIASIWTALILFACFLPGNEVPNIQIPLMDKWVHFIIFAGFSFLWLCTIKQPKAITYLIVFAASVVLGYMVELIQGSGLTQGRAYDNNDIIADAIGGLIGVVLFHLQSKRFVI